MRCDTHAGLSIYPSLVASGETFTVEMDNAGTLELYDAVGRRAMVHRIVASKQTISTTGLSAGMYMIRCHDPANGLIGISRLVVE